MSPSDATLKHPVSNADSTNVEIMCVDPYYTLNGSSMPLENSGTTDSDPEGL
ncbi:MAG: hypothetical protein HLUCCO16_12335 [Phormidium sp. OSCR]|nr:MAG: hypothetical protein HLUCCO16_12335 [Phormidium sp. OSCR]